MKALSQLILNNPSNTILLTPKEKEGLPEIIVSPTLLDLPENFDGRKVWEGLLSPVMEQGKCGSCWAFASTSVLSDKFNIDSFGALSIQLSPTKLILCDWGDKKDGNYLSENIMAKENLACTGNTLLDAWRYLYVYGTPTIQCMPYNTHYGHWIEHPELTEYTSPSDLPQCRVETGYYSDMCSDYRLDDALSIERGTPAKNYRSYNYYLIPGTGKGSEYNIRYNIYKAGPVTSAMILYEDFYTFDFKNNIYEWNNKGNPISGHAVEITGWGIDNGIPYWQIKNSWGLNWGDNGYFKIVRGKNNCDIENNVMSGIPDFGITYTPTPTYDILFDKSLEENKFRQERDKAGFNGGIDPKTGYSRRVLDLYPWTKNDVINPSKLLDWNTFIAGVDASPQNRNRYRLLFTGQGNKKWIWIIVIAGIILLGFILFLIIKKNPHSNSLGDFR